jgi:hypothetical protein
MKQIGWLAALLVAACGEPALEDAGVDAGIDAGADAGRADDAGRDAGVDAGRDSGVPASAVVAAEMTESEAAEVETLEAALPPDDLDTAPFATLDACLTAIDHIIGETGIQTLTLSDGAVRALADYHVAGRVWMILAGVSRPLSLSADPDLMALAVAIEELRTALSAYRDEVYALYVERRDAEPLFTPVRMVYATKHTAVTTGRALRFEMLTDFVPGGAPASANVSVDCTGALMPATASLIEQDPGDATTSLSPSGAATVVPIPVTRPTTLWRVQLDGAARTVATLSTCTVTLETFRSLRAAPRQLTSTALAAAIDDYELAIGAYHQELSTAQGIDAARAYSVEELINLMNDLIAPLMTPLDLDTVPLLAFEDTDLVYRMHRYVDEMLTRVLASPQLASLPALVARAGELQAAVQAIVDASRSL